MVGRNQEYSIISLDNSRLDIWLRRAKGSITLSTEERTIWIVRQQGALYEVDFLMDIP